MSKRRAAVVAVGTVLVTVLLSGCATDQGGTAQETPNPMTTTSPPEGQVSPLPSDTGPPRLPPTSPDRVSGEVTLTGDVKFVEVEGGCLTLQVNNKGYELMGGDRGKLVDGARVTVRGRVRNDILTTCQVGPVIEVLEVRPA